MCSSAAELLATFCGERVIVVLSWGTDESCTLVRSSVVRLVHPHRHFKRKWTSPSSLSGRTCPRRTVYIPPRHCPPRTSRLVIVRLIHPVSSLSASYIPPRHCPPRTSPSLLSASYIPSRHCPPRTSPSSLSASYIPIVISKAQSPSSFQLSDWTFSFPPPELLSKRISAANLGREGEHETDCQLFSTRTNQISSSSETASSSQRRNFSSIKPQPTRDMFSRSGATVSESQTLANFAKSVLWSLLEGDSWCLCVAT